MVCVAFSWWIWCFAGCDLIVFVFGYYDEFVALMWATQFGGFGVVGIVC